MRLFPKVDGTIDRFDRGGLLTIPFDLGLIVIAGPGMWACGQVYMPGFQVGEVYKPGLQQGEVYKPGFQQGQAK